jgi:hypothetical protein
MAAQASTMINPSIPSSAPARSPFPRRVIILFLLMISTVLGLILLFRQRPETPLLVAIIFTDLILGLVAGLGTRIFLRNRGALVRFFAGTGTLIIGLFVLGLLTDWRLGFGPLEFWRDTIDWIGLAQISLGTLTFLLTMQAWSKPIRVSPTTTPPVKGPASQPAQTPPPIRPKVKTKRKKLKQPRSPLTLFKSKPAQAKPSSKPVISSKKAIQAITKPKRSIFRRKPQVHLSKIERHLCPYCLDPVTRNDVRGVVECDICHTLHHGDCWAIAGACQVPHYTS